MTTREALIIRTSKRIAKEAVRQACYDLGSDADARSRRAREAVRRQAYRQADDFFSEDSRQCWFNGERASFDRGRLEHAVAAHVVSRFDDAVRARTYAAYKGE